MAKVTFVGRDDQRILSADDLKKAGVEGFTKTTFVKGQAAEVSPEVAKALTENVKLFGKFRVEEEKAETAKK